MNYRDIRRGDIFYIKNDDNAVGFEQKKTRPALIVSNDANNRVSDHIAEAPSASDPHSSSRLRSVYRSL